MPYSRLILAIIFIFLSISNSISQTKMILRADGNTFQNRNELDIDGHEIKPLKQSKKAIKDYYSKHNYITDLNTILNYTFPPTGNSNFGFFGQDRLLQWFIAPADMEINAFGFNTSEVESVNLEVEVKLIKFAWTEEQLIEYFYEDGAMKSAHQLGYYIATGNGFNDITAFKDDLDYLGEGWVDINSSGFGEIFGNDMWSDQGVGVSIAPVPTGEVNTYQWVDLDTLINDHLLVLKGEVIGVALKNVSPDFDLDRIGVLASKEPGIPGFKYYANGKDISGGPGIGDCGWWSEEFTWDFALDIRIPDCFPTPMINDMTVLKTTLSTQPREVRAEIIDDTPSGGQSGLEWVKLHNSINGGEFNEVFMNHLGENIYFGFIPGAEPGKKISYFVSAKDVDGNSNDNSSSAVTYHIFASTPDQKNLVVWNTDLPDYSAYYFDHNNEPKTMSFDFWAYGPLSIELLAHYDNIIENTTLGPKDINSDTLRVWLDSNPDHNYFLFGDEWLGTQTEWSDTTYGEGDFQYDVLGISKDYNDIHDGHSDTTWSTVIPVENSLIGDPLYNLHQQISADSGWSAPIQVDPEAMFGDASNWLDGIEFKEDVDVFMKGIGDDGKIYDIGGSRTLPAGNKIAFLATDPLAFQSDWENGIEKYWYGLTPQAPQNVIARWFDMPTDVSDEYSESTPAKFELKQNYPNPFNGTTAISYELTAKSNTLLIVYDILGREVATLVNKEQNTGSYKVEFDASNLSSGLYFYQLKAADFMETKKMVYLK